MDVVIIDERDSCEPASTAEASKVFVGMDSGDDGPAS